MISIKENALEWAFKHLTRYYDSDFYPKSFEFEAIASNWTSVKSFIISLDLKEYTPKSPFISLAPKANGTYRMKKERGQIYFGSPFSFLFKLPHYGKSRTA